MALQEEPGARRAVVTVRACRRGGSGVGSVLGEVPDGDQSKSSAPQSPALCQPGTPWPQHPCPSLAGAPRSAQTCILLQLFLHFAAPGWCAFLNSSFVTEHHTVAQDAGNGPRPGLLAGEIGPRESTGPRLVPHWPRESLPYVLEVGTASPASRGPMRTEGGWAPRPAEQAQAPLREAGQLISASVFYIIR